MAVVERSARVRPRFRRFAIIAFIILVPIAVHAAWDHYEARRLSRIVSDIRSRNEPFASTPTVPDAESPDNAARYYEAAAALVDARDFYGATGLLRRMDHAPETERPQLVRDIRSWLERNREAEALLARATELPFQGYMPGTYYNYRADRLSKLARLANLRTFERLEAGDADAAAESIIQQIRINRPLSASGPTDLGVIGMGRAATPALREMSRLIAAVPSDSSLTRVQSAIREMNHDSLIEQSMLAERAFYLSRFWNESRGWYARPSPRDVPNDTVWFLMRPMTARRMVDMINIMSALIDRAREPWPTRLHVDVSDSPPGPPPRNFPFVSFAQAHQMLGSSYRWRARSIATALALARTSDAAIAVERYRRATGALPDSLAQLVPSYLPNVPIDPYSGREVKYAKTADRGVVYSVGRN